MEPPIKKDMKFIKFIFEGIFIDNKEYKDLYKKYNDFILFLDKKNIHKFDLSLNEIDEIILLDKDAWKIISCEVEFLINFGKNGRYEITLVLENISFKRKISYIRTFMKKIYHFKYKEENYSCFILESLYKKLADIKEIHDFRIIALKNGQKIIAHPYFILDIEFETFTIEVNYKYKDIKIETLKFNDIYKMPKIIKGKDLNLKLGLYTNLMEDDFEKFVFYETAQRNNFLNNLKRLFHMKKYIGLCGPYGTGKTITLLKFLIQSDLNRVFYINLWTIENTSTEELKNLFKYELIKLFGLNIFNSNDILCSKEEEKNYQNIIKEVNEFNGKNIFILLENIIKYIDNIKDEETIYYIIIDQYSSKYDENNLLLKQLLEKNKDKNIYFIISSSMNNDDIKKIMNIPLILNLSILKNFL